MTTIQDVARHAAVSVSTVSNVLNGRSDRMRPETLARVEATIEALRFSPNRLARQLKTGQTPLLGLLAQHVGYRHALLVIIVPVVLGLLVVNAAAPLKSRGIA